MRTRGMPEEYVKLLELIQALTIKVENLEDEIKILRFNLKVSQIKSSLIR